MRVSVEWFLLDNFAVNWLLLKLAEALGGAAVGRGRAALACLMGAVWDLLAMGKWPRLLSLPGRISCLLATALFLGWRTFFRSLLSLFAASLLLGGGLLLLTLGRSGPWAGGVLLGTVPLRAAVYGLCLLPILIRGARYLVHRGYEGSCRRTIALTVGDRAFTLTAFVDSGNLLTEPLTGLPVVLVEGIRLPIGRPLTVEGWGPVEVVPGTVETGQGSVPVFVGRSPLPLIDFQALLPGAALHEGRKRDVHQTQSVFLSALRAAVHSALSVLSHPHGGEPAPAAEPRGGARLRASGSPGERGGPEPAHRAQFAAGGVHRPKV